MPVRPPPRCRRLRALLDSPRHEVVAVVTRPPAAAGRGRRAAASPVEELAREAGVAVLAPARAGDPEFLAELAELGPDCCPVVAYGALLPPAALTVPTHGWVNLHFSLLPAWRGAAPVQRAILAGDEITGASTFQIEAGLDTGPVFGVVTEAIRPDRHQPATCSRRLADSGAALLRGDDGRHRGRHARRPPAAGRRRLARGQADRRRRAHRLDRRRRSRSTGGSGPARPRPAPGPTFRGERLKLGPVASGRAATAPDELARRASSTVDRGAVRVGTGAGPVELARCSRPASG